MCESEYWTAGGAGHFQIKHETYQLGMPVLRKRNKGAQALRHCLVCPSANGLPEALAESLVPMKTDLFADLSAVSGDRKIVQQAQAHIGRALVSGSGDFTGSLTQNTITPQVSPSVLKLSQLG